MWPKFGYSSISVREVIKYSILWGFDLKNCFFFLGSSWFKVNKYGLSLGKDLKFYTSLAKGLKSKSESFGG